MHAAWLIGFMCPACSQGFQTCANPYEMAAAKNIDSLYQLMGPASYTVSVLPSFANAAAQHRNTASEGEAGGHEQPFNVRRLT